jgi:Dynamin family
MNSRRLRLVPDMNGELSPTIPEAAGSSLPHERAVLAATLSDIDSIVTSLLQGGSPLAGRLHVLRDRLSRERLQLAVLGQFKRGKSTFINALLGANLLPTGVIPLTAVATFISWRPEPLVVIRFHNGGPTQQFPVRTTGRHSPRRYGNY